MKPTTNSVVVGSLAVAAHAASIYSNVTGLDHWPAAQAKALDRMISLVSRNASNPEAVSPIFKLTRARAFILVSLSLPNPT